MNKTQYKSTRKDNERKLVESLLDTLKDKKLECIKEMDLANNSIFEAAKNIEDAIEQIKETK